MISLRPFSPGDLEAVWTWASDPTFCRFLTWSPYESRRALQSHLEHAGRATGEPDHFAAIVEDGEVVGSLHAIRRDERRVQVGVGVTPARWGRGIGTRALSAFLQGIARSWPGDTFIGDVDVRNHRAAAVARTLGFRRTGEVVTETRFRTAASMGTFKEEVR